MPHTADWLARLRKHRYAAWIGAAAIGCALALLPFVLSSVGTAWVRITNLAILFAILSLGLNVVVGFAGLLDLGYIAFYGVGAYCYALLASPHFGLHLPFWIILPIGAGGRVHLRHPAGRADAQAARRLPRHRDARASARSCASFSTTCRSRSTSPTDRRASR